MYTKHMSEVHEGIRQYEGPYDLYERYISDATELDSMLLANQYELEELQDVRDYLNELEMSYGNPMMGSRVTLRGEYAVRKIDEDGDELLYFDGTIGESYGVYKGLYVFPMLHQVGGESLIYMRVMHRLKHEPEIHFDHLGDMHEITRSTYVSVQGTTLETDSVLNAHSLRYLSGQENWLAASAAERIDVIVNSEEPATIKTNQLLAYLQTNLADILRDSKLRTNLFSYINSLGFFQNIELLSSVFIYEADDEYHARFSHRNTYHLKRPTGITARPDILVENGQVTDEEGVYNIFFAIHDDDLGQVLIPSNSKYTVVVDPE